MKITIPPLDAEQQVALGQLVVEYNNQAKASLSNEEFCSLVLMNVINDRKRQNIIAKGEELIAAAQSLPDDKRIQFTADVEAAYAHAVL